MLEAHLHAIFVHANGDVIESIQKEWVLKKYGQLLYLDMISPYTCLGHCERIVHILDHKTVEGVFGALAILL